MVIENSGLKLLPPSLVTRHSYFGNILTALVRVQPGSGYETSCRPQEGVRDLPAQRGPYLVFMGVLKLLAQEIPIYGSSVGTARRRGLRIPNILDTGRTASANPLLSPGGGS